MITVQGQSWFLFGEAGEVYFYFCLYFTQNSQIPAFVDQPWLTKKTLLLPHDEANSQTLVDFPGKQH